MKSEATRAVPSTMKRMFVMLLAGGSVKSSKVTFDSVTGGAWNQGAGVVETPVEVTQKSVPLEAKAQYQSTAVEEVPGVTSRVNVVGPATVTTGGVGCRPLTLRPITGGVVVVPH